VRNKIFRTSHIINQKGVKKMFFHKLLLGLTFCLLAVATVKAEEVEPYYEAKGDKPMKLEKWAKRGIKAKVDFAGPADLNGKKAYKIELTLDGKGFCYYKLPLGVTMLPGEKYFLKEKYMVSKLPAGCKVQLGALICFCPDAKSHKDISFIYCPIKVQSPGKEMQPFISAELNAQSAAQMKKRKIKAEKIMAQNVLILITGEFKKQKVELWLSDIALLPEKPK